ncbi:hypothetical protein X474_06505 [Dethiosulfatarculus sandiegensis]|uniref:Uncharacterized protein n=1 Tax=Dethiosulfatarculus sandiegensis TaxID=1429043 RepID=A0A0D2JZ05_9BACT|nr:hypothetical protein X474_06505 [Dethiosulfatarculus sandiegensis]
MLPGKEWQPFKIKKQPVFRLDLNFCKNPSNSLNKGGFHASNYVFRQTGAFL